MMRTVLLAVVVALGLGNLTGCGSSSASKSDAAPPPQDSGANKEKVQRPGPPPK